MKYSIEIQDIIKSSRQVAVDLGTNHISSYHVLLSILRHNNLPKIIFNQCNYDFEYLNKTLLNSQKYELIETYFLTTELEKTLKSVNFYSWINNKNEVLPEHLIFSMLADQDSLGGSYLLSLGMNYDLFKNECNKIEEINSKVIFEKIGKNEFCVEIGLVKLINKVL